MCKCTGQSLSVHTHTEREERHVLSARTLSEREQLISERVRPVLCESKGNPRESKGNPRASREIRARAKEIRARAERFARKQGDSRWRIILIYFRATKMCSRHLAVK